MNTCEHWNLAFKVFEPTIYISCMACKAKAMMYIDGRNGFTTTWARVALDQVLDGKVTISTIQKPWEPTA